MKNSKRVSISIILALALALLPFPQHMNENVKAASNTNYTVKKSIYGKLGKRPSSIEVTKPQTSTKKGVQSFPSSYDLRKLNKVTIPKSQGNNNDCWAFAATGALESDLLTKGLGNYDLSENNVVTGCLTSDYYDDGGNRDMATAYYARWAGPVNEDQDPDSQDSVINRGAFSPSVHVQDVLYLPNRTSSLDNAEIKSAIMNYGAIDSSMCWADEYYDPNRFTYYDNMDKSDDNNGPNHDITIVGWDDNYSKDNFYGSPSGNGAFICKNSWGTDWGDNGYFYVSYYDSVIGTDNTVFTAESSNNYDEIYQYDKNDMNSRHNFGTNQVWFANKFQADSKPQSLAAVSFYVTCENTYYEIYYSLGDNSFTNLKKLKTGYIDKAGYRTIKLDSMAEITPGQKYTVAVMLKTPTGDAWVPIERQDDYLGINVQAAKDRSYESYDGQTWRDVNEYKVCENVCLKAFTEDKPLVLQKDYTKWPDQTTTDVNKVWNVKFNNAVNSSTINSDNVYIYNNFQRKLKSSVWLDPDSKTIHVSVPSGTYQTGQSYTLVIDSGVSTLNGKKIAKPVVMNFTVK